MDRGIDGGGSFVEFDMERSGWGESEVSLSDQSEGTVRQSLSM